jgi:hypothetical protein
MNGALYAGEANGAVCGWHRACSSAARPPQVLISQTGEEVGQDGVAQFRPGPDVLA